MSKENWKPIPGYEARYEISDQGRIKSLAKGKEKILKPAINNGNERAILCDGKGKNLPLLVHRLVMLAFVGPSEYDVKRRDNTLDPRKANRLENLYYDGEDAPTVKKESGLSKLSKDAINRIKEMLGLKISQRRIAKECGVAQSTVSRINSGWVS